MANSGGKPVTLVTDYFFILFNERATDREENN